MYELELGILFIYVCLKKKNMQIKHCERGEGLGKNHDLTIININQLIFLFLFLFFIIDIIEFELIVSAI